MDNLRIKYNNLFINKALFIRFYVIQTTIRNNNISTLKIIVTENNKDNIWNIMDTYCIIVKIVFLKSQFVMILSCNIETLKSYIFSVICKYLSI